MFRNVKFQLSLRVTEYVVFKIPPLKANEGHRAGEWGDLAQPLWKGRLRILEKNSGVTILFEDGTTGVLTITSKFIMIYFFRRRTYVKMPL